jgi:hypothetical protein
MVKFMLAGLAALAFGLIAGWSIVALSPASVPAAAPAPAAMPKASMPVPAPSADGVAPHVSPVRPQAPAAAPPPPRPAVTRTVESTFARPATAAAAPAVKKDAWESERAWRAVSRYLRYQDDNDD